MDAIGTSALLSATYRRYLRSLLPVRDPALAAALADCIAASPLLTKGPLLEATPPYRTGATLRGLIGDGVLDPAFARLDGPALPLDRPLYLHQEQALRKAAAGRSLVVATGTGSGKTESFLLPVLSALTAEHTAPTTSSAGCAGCWPTRRRSPSAATPVTRRSAPPRARRSMSR